MNTLRTRDDKPFLPSDLSPAGLIERAAFASFLAVHENAEEVDVCRRLWPNDRAAPLLVSRAAAAVGSTTAPGWAAELAQRATGAFFASLAPISAAAALVDLGLRVTLGRSATMVIPARSGAAPLALPWVAENGVIPVRIQSIAAATLDPRKMAVIIAFSRELARRSSAELVFTSMLREEASMSLDAAYFSAAAGSASVHPGLLLGVTPTPGFGDMAGDLGALASAVGVGGSGQVVFIAGPALAAAIQIRLPNLKFPVFPSLAVPVDRIIAVDPAALAHGFGDDPEIMASEEALLHMTDTASGSIMAGDPVRSMYQTAGIALRLIVDVAFAARRTLAVAYIDGIVYSA